MIANRCPSRDEISDVLLGCSAEDRIDELTEHVASCPDCEHTVDAIEANSDTLVDCLHGLPSDLSNASRNEELNELMASVKTLVYEHETDERENFERDVEVPPAAVRQLDEYDLLEEIGRGGMGTVHRAVHRRLGKQVAVKLLAPHRVRDRRSASRFNREMRAIGMFEHPNIVRAIDAGEDDGYLYLVMELVDGPDAGDIVRQHKQLAVADACEVIRQAAVGLEHARRHGLVHRDVKPSNLLIDADGTVKVADLGLARFEQVAEDDDLTSVDHTMGSVDYMSPEQANDSRSVDTRGDIYSLGCTFYKLLTGVAPFQQEGIDTLVKKVMAHQQKPARPIGEFRDDVPQRVIDIVERMISKDPSDRQATPAEIAKSLRRWSKGSDLGKLSAEGLRSRSRETSVESYHEPEFSRIPLRSRGTSRNWLIAIALLIGIGITAAFLAPSGTDSTSDNQSQAADDEPIVFRNTQLNQFDQPQSIQALAYSPDGSMIAAAADDHTITIRNAQTAKVRSVLDGHEDSVTCVAFSPDKQRLASGSLDQTVRVWNLSTGKVIATLEGHTNWVFSVVFSPDGKQLASSGYDKTIRFWDTTTLKPAGEIMGHSATVRSLAFSPDGKTLASGSADLTARVWDVVAKKEVKQFKGHKRGIRAVAFSPDGKTLATAAEDSTVRLWDVATGEMHNELTGHSGIVWSLAFSPKGRSLASGAIDGRVKLWDPSTGKLRSTLTGHTDVVSSVAFAPDTSALATGSFDKSIKIWRANASAQNGLAMTAVDFSLPGSDKVELLRLEGHKYKVGGVAFSPNGRQLASAGNDGTVRVWDLTLADVESGVLRSNTTIATFEKSIWNVAYSGDGRRLAFGSAHAASTLVDATTYEVVARYDFLRPLDLDLSPDGRYLFATNTGVQIWDTNTERDTRRVGNRPNQLLRGIDVSSDGTLVAAAGSTRDIRVWKTDTRELVHTFDGHEDTVYALKFTSDATRLVSAGMDNDRKVKIWDIATGQAITLEGHQGAVPAVDITPDDRILASMSHDRSVRLWNLSNGEPLEAVRFPAGCTSINFSPDGRTLAVGQLNGVIRIINIQAALKE